MKDRSIQLEIKGTKTEDTTLTTLTCMASYPGAESFKDLTTDKTPSCDESSREKSG